MADGLSVAASIAGLFTVAEAVTRKTYQYIKEAKNANKEISKLLSETTELFAILHGLHLVALRFEGEEFDRTIQTRHIHSCYVLLDKLDSKLVDCSPSNYSNSRKVLLKKLAWPFSSSETKEMIVELERQKSTLKLALSVDSMSALLLTLSRQEVQGAHLADIRNDVRHLREIKEDEKRKKLLRSLTTVDTERNQEIGIHLRQPGTGVWFLESQGFQNWLEEDRSKLWLHGIPGAGKTILSSTIIQALQKPEHKDKALGYFYCDYKNPETWNHLNILGSLIKQLASQHDDCFRDLEDYNKDHNLDSSGLNPLIKSTEEAISLLQQMSNHFDQTMIIVDGLDELGAIGSGSSRSSVTLVLKSLVSDYSSIKMMFLSRREQDLINILSDYAQISITAQGSDLALYVGSEIEKRISEKQLRIKSQALKEEIRKRLVEGADGMFRWVSCQMDYLCQLPTDGARRRALEHLPPTLHETYERILSRVDGEDNKLAVKRVLTWTMFSREVLPISVLLEAVSINQGDTSLESDDIYDEETVLGWCSSLLRRSSDGTGLELAHFTVKEFLLDNKKDPGFMHFHLEQISGDIEIAKTCLAYLCFDRFEASLGDADTEMILEPRRELYMIKSLYQYAALYWDSHSYGHFDDQEIMDIAQKLFNPSKTPQFILWSQFLSNFHANASQNSPSVLSMTPLHWACCLALQPICEWLVQYDNVVDKAGGPGTPLQCALKSVFLYGRYDGLSRDVEYDPSWRPSARFEVVQMLLHAGAKVDCSPGRDFQHDSPLEIAIRVGDRSLTRLLLSAGAKVTLDLLKLMEKECRENREGEDYLNDIAPENLSDDSKPLYAELALSFNNSDQTILHGMLEGTTQELSSERITEELGPALRKAARLGQIASLTKLLSHRGLQVDTVDALNGSTALHHATEVGQLEAVKLLMKYGSDPNKADGNNQTAIHLAVREGHIEIFQWLKEHGAVLTQISTTGMTLLHAAASGANSALLQTFLEGTECSDLEVRTQQSLTPLMCAAQSGSVSVVSLLLQKSSMLDVLSTTDNGLSCLHLAAINRDEDKIKIFLAAGIPVNSQANDGSTPLHLLLDLMDSTHHLPSGTFSNMSDVSSDFSSDFSGYTTDSDDHYNNELDDIEESRVLRCFQTLICSGADLLHLREDGLSPVHILCLKALPPCVKMLREVLQKVKDSEDLPRIVNHQSNLGLTPLHQLISIRDRSKREVRVDMINCLLKNSVLDINWLDNNQRTPLVSLLRNLDGISHNPLFGPQLLSRLIRHGANVHLPCMEGRTALHYLMDFDLSLTRSQSAHILLDESATVDSKDGQARSVCDIVFSKWTQPTTDRIDDLRSITLRIVKQAPLDHLHGIRVNGLSVLSVALKSKDEAVTQAILDRGGFDPSLRNTDIYKYSALELACIEGCTQNVAQRLVANHPDTSQLHSSGKGPIHFAAENNQDTILELLLQNLDVDTRTGGATLKHTPLHLAAEKGNLSTVELLLSNGADVTVRDKWNWSVTRHAVLSGSKDVCELILKHVQTGWNEPVLQQTLSGEIYEFNALHTAASLGMIHSIEFLLDNGLAADVNLKAGKREHTPLHDAVLFCMDDAISCLLARGADVNAKNSAGETPLLIAARNSKQPNSKLIVTLLLEHGSDIETRSKIGLTAELAALSQGRKDIAQIIKSKAKSLEGIRSSESDQTNHEDVSAKLSGTLRDAILSKNLGLCKELINNGLSVNQKLPCGCTPLLCALETKQKQLAEFLLEEGAVVSVENCNNHGGAFDRFRPVHFAAWNGDKETLQRILKIGPPLTGIGIEPIHLAAAVGSANCLKVLLEHEKSTTNAKRLLNVLANTTNENYLRFSTEGYLGGSALHIACANGHEEAMTFLLAEGTDIEILDNTLYTPLTVAVRHNQLKITRKLLISGANVNNRGMFGDTPFINAATAGYVDMLNLLKGFKCDTTAMTIWGETALHVSHIHAIPKLLDWGLDLELLDNTGNSALAELIYRSDSGGVLALKHLPDDFNPCKHLCNEAYGNILTCALANNRPQSARKILDRVHRELLTEFVNQPSSIGTPLYVAAYTGSTEIIELLLGSDAILDLIGGELGTALHAACSMGRVDAVSLLLKRGARLKVYSENGHLISAFECANQHPRVLELLRARRWMLMNGRRTWRSQPQLIYQHAEQSLWHFGVF